MLKYLILLIISLPFVLSIGKVCNIVDTNDICFAMCCSPFVLLELIGLYLMIRERRKYG